MKDKMTLIGTPWWLRLAIYTIVAAIGLVLTFMGIVAPEQVDGWLAGVPSIAALIGGLLAIANTGKASDSQMVEVPVSVEIEEQFGAAFEHANLEIERMAKARLEAEALLNDINSKVGRVQAGEPIFSVFH